MKGWLSNCAQHDLLYKYFIVWSVPRKEVPEEVLTWQGPTCEGTDDLPSN